MASPAAGLAVELPLDARKVAAQVVGAGDVDVDRRGREPGRRDDGGVDRPEDVDPDVLGAHAETLPTSSTTRVRKLCMPWVPIRTIVPSGPEPGVSASICHSTWSTPESASVPSTLRSTACGCQPTGGCPSCRREGCCRFDVEVSSLRLPAESTAAVSSVCVPVPVTVAVPLRVQRAAVVAPFGVRRARPRRSR